MPTKNLKKVSPKALAQTRTPFRPRSVPVEAMVAKPESDPKYKGYILFRAEKNVPWEARLSDGTPNCRYFTEMWVPKTGPGGKEQFEKVRSEPMPIDITANELRYNFRTVYIGEIDFGQNPDGTPRQAVLPAVRKDQSGNWVEKEDTFESARVMFGKKIGEEIHKALRLVDLKANPPFLVLEGDFTGEFPQYSYRPASEEELSKLFRRSEMLSKEELLEEANKMFDPAPTWEMPKF